MEGCLVIHEPRGSTPNPDLGIREGVILQLWPDEWAEGYVWVCAPTHVHCRDGANCPKTEGLSCTCAWESKIQWRNWRLFSVAGEKGRRRLKEWKEARTWETCRFVLKALGSHRGIESRRVTKRDLPFRSLTQYGGQTGEVRLRGSEATAVIWVRKAGRMWNEVRSSG